jgi:hypothetical protein
MKPGAPCLITTAIELRHPHYDNAAAHDDYRRDPLGFEILAQGIPRERETSCA